MLPRKLSSSFIAIAILAAPALSWADPPTSTNIYMYGRLINTAEVYDPSHRCYTQDGQAGVSTRLLCGAINRLMITDWNNARSSDLVPIPHRGLWGGAGGSKTTVAENAMGAFKAALDAGYRVLEIDAAVAGPSCPTAYGDVFVGHYFSMLAAGGDVAKRPCDYTANNIAQFSMRLRDGRVNNLESNKLVNITDVIRWAKDNQVLLMVDPKVPGLTPQEERSQYSYIIFKVLESALSNSALENVAIKTTYGYSESLLFFPYGDYDRYYKGKFLWSPIINKSSCMTKGSAEGGCNDGDTGDEISTVIGAAKSWRYETNDSKQIATYEVQLYNRDHWASKPFAVSGVHYENLVDFVARQTVNCPAKSWLCKRSAIWSVDPASDKGTLSRDYGWKFIGNTVGRGAWKDDQRGSPFVTLGYGASTNGSGFGSPLYAAVITDRPDVYSQMQVAGAQSLTATNAQDEQP